MDLSTTYLGFELAHPIMPGASPLTDDLDSVRQLEDAGAAAIVLSSLFEEQIEDDQLSEHPHPRSIGESLAELHGPLPEPEQYLEHVRRVKAAVDVPVIASLNGTTSGGWLDYAALIEEAGADALELNVYDLATDPWESAAEVEARILDMVRSVKERMKMPLAVKLSPFYTSFANVAQQLDDAGADGLVLFNRFYQPSIDVDRLEVRTSLRLSDSSELLLRLRWLAILTGEVRASMAVTGGVQVALDAVKAIMCGASAVQVVSALFKHGPRHLATLRRELEGWMERRDYASLADLHGTMSLELCPDPHAFERRHYIETLRNWWRSIVSV